MKKVLSTVLFAAMGLSMFAAPIKLTVLDYADETSPNAYEDRTLVWERFEKDNPDIEIVREVLFNDPFHQKTESYAAMGKMPDVFYMWPAGRSTPIHEKKLAKDLTPLLKRDGLLDKYSAACMDPAQQKSGYIAEIPFGLTTTNCTFVNTKILKECGLEVAKTYEELVAQIPVLKAKGYKTLIMGAMDDWVIESCLFSMVAGRMGGATWADDIMSGKKKFTDEPFLSAVKMMKRMYDDGVLTQEALATPYGDVQGQFAAGKAAYMVDGDWKCGAFMTDTSTGKALIEPAKQESDIELTQFPALPGEVLAMSNSGTLGVGYGMSAKIEDGSEKEEAAWRLIKWLSGQEVQQRRLDTGASFPSWKEGLDYSKLEPIAKKRAQWYNTAAVVTPVYDSVFTGDVNTVFCGELQKMGLGMTTPEEVCEATQKAFWEKYPELKPAEPKKAKKKHWWQRG